MSRELVSPFSQCSILWMLPFAFVLVCVSTRVDACVPVYDSLVAGRAWLCMAVHGCCTMLFLAGVCAGPPQMAISPGLLGLYSGVGRPVDAKV